MSEVWKSYTYSSQMRLLWETPYMSCPRNWLLHESADVAAGDRHSPGVRCGDPRHRLDPLHHGPQQGGTHHWTFNHSLTSMLGGPWVAELLRLRLVHFQHFYWRKCHEVRFQNWSTRAKIKALYHLLIHFSDLSEVAKKRLLAPDSSSSSPKVVVCCL